MAVNKIFKDNIKLLFEKDRLFFDNNYMSLDEQKIRDSYLYDLNISDNIEILDDISNELNIDISSNEEEENEDLNSSEEKEKFNIDIPEDYKNEIEKMDKTFKIENDDLMDLD